MDVTLHFIQAQCSQEGFTGLDLSLSASFQETTILFQLWGNMVEQFCQTKQEGMCAQRQCAPIHKHTQRSRYFLFVLFPCAAAARDGAEVRKRPDLNTRSQSKNVKRENCDGSDRGGSGVGVCDKRSKASWEITGVLHEPRGSRDLERANAGRRQGWNSLTLFGGLEAFA